MRSGYKATGAKAMGWAKQFGVLTALFGGVECVVEKYRAKHDVWNPVISGCAVGATLSASGGPGVRLPRDLLTHSLTHSRTDLLTDSLTEYYFILSVCILVVFVSHYLYLSDQ
jgi:hypothetical protein